MNTKTKIIAALSIFAFLWILLIGLALYNDSTEYQPEINIKIDQNDISYVGNASSNGAIMKLTDETVENGGKIMDLSLIDKRHSNISISVTEITPKQTSSQIITNKPIITIAAPESVQNGDIFVVDFIIDPADNKIEGIEANLFMKNIKAESVDLINSEEFSMPGEINVENIQNIALTNKSGFSGRFMSVKFAAIIPGKANIEIRSLVVDDHYATSEIITSKDFEVKG